MTGVISILAQQLADAQQAGDLPRQIALASAMLKERADDPDELYVIIATACRELVIANDPSDLNAVLGWYQAWYRHLRDPAVADCVDATKERISYVEAAEQALHTAINNRDVGALQTAIEHLESMTDRLSNTERLIEQAKTILQDQIKANQHVMTDRRRRSDMLLRSILQTIPERIDEAYESFTKLQSLDPNAAADPSFTSLPERLEQLIALHEAIEQAIASGSMESLREAVDALTASADRLSTSEVLLEQAQQALSQRGEQVAELKQAYEQLDASRPDIVVPALENLVALSGDPALVRTLENQQAAWTNLRAWHAIIEDENSSTHDLTEAVSSLRNSRQKLKESGLVLRKGESRLAVLVRARRRKQALVGMLIIGVLIVGGLFTAMWWRDNAAAQAVLTAQDPQTGLSLADTYLSENHVWYQDDVRRVRQQFQNQLTEQTLTRLGDMTDRQARLEQINQLLSAPDLDQKETFVELKERTEFELADQDFAAANAHADLAQRISALETYIVKSTDQQRIEKAKKIIAAVKRERDDAAWAAVEKATEDEQKLAAIEHYLQLPEPRMAEAALTIQKMVREAQQRRDQQAAEQARWQAIERITDPEEAIVALNKYIDAGGPQSSAARSRLKTLLREQDDTAWEIAKAAETPSERVARARAYLARSGQRAHDQDAQRQIDRGLWDEAMQPEDSSERLHSLATYLSMQGELPYRTQAKAEYERLQKVIDDANYKQAVENSDIETRIKALTDYATGIITPTRHQQDAIEALVEIARSMIATNPDKVVSMPAAVVQRLPITSLAELPGEAMRQLPSTLQLRIPVRPAWSSAANVDAYGRWADLVIGEQTLRFRYITEGHMNLADGKEVKITTPFWLAETECTQRVWVEVMGGVFSSGNPSRHKGDDLPVNNVSYKAAQNFLTKANAQLAEQRVKGQLRLPSVSEWRYVAITGIEGVEATVRHVIRGYDARDRARLIYGSENGSAPVAASALRRDQWGLIDIMGNVSEWVGGTADGKAFWVGGSWTVQREHAQVDTHGLAAVDQPLEQVGLRLVVSDLPPAP